MIEQLYYISNRFDMYRTTEDCEPTGRWRIDKTYSGTTFRYDELFIEVYWYNSITKYFIKEFPFISKHIVKYKHIQWVNEEKLNFYTKYSTKEGKIENCNNISGEASES